MCWRWDSDEVRVIVFMSVCVLTLYYAAAECDWSAVWRLGLGEVWCSLCGEGRKIECSEYCRRGVDEEKFFGGISETGTRCRLLA